MAQVPIESSGGYYGISVGFVSIGPAESINSWSTRLPPLLRPSTILCLTVNIGQQLHQLFHTLIQREHSGGLATAKTIHACGTCHVLCAFHFWGTRIYIRRSAIHTRSRVY